MTVPETDRGRPRDAEASDTCSHSLGKIPYYIDSDYALALR